MRIALARLLPLAIAALALEACSVAAAPDDLIQLNYMFAGDVDANIAGRKNRTSDPTAWWISYEFLPLRENANLAFSYFDRQDDLQGKPATRIDSQALRLQLRSHHGQADGLAWYLGPGIGYVVDATDTAGGKYDASLFYDLEIGVRLRFAGDFGVAGTVNYARIGLDGNPGTRNTDLDGFTTSVGVFLDF